MELPADSSLLTLESITIVCCLNAKTVLVRQLLLVFIPTCQLLATNTRVFTEVYGNYLQHDMSLCSKFIREFCQETQEK